MQRKSLMKKLCVWLSAVMIISLIPVYSMPVRSVRAETGETGGTAQTASSGALEPGAGTPANTDELSALAIFKNHYGAGATYDVFRTPSYPVADKEQRFYRFTSGYYDFDSKRTTSLSDGDYLQFSYHESISSDALVDDLCNTGKKYVVSLALYRQDGTLKKDITDAGGVVFYGPSTEAGVIFCELNRYAGLLLTDQKYEYSHELYYTPSIGKVTLLSELASYKAGSASDPKHAHGNWSYALNNGNTIEAVCGVTDPACNITTPLTLTLSAESVIYSGNPYNGASVSDDISSVTGASVSGITYYEADGQGSTNIVGNALASAPSAPGDYVAMVTLTDGSNQYTVKASFSINPQAYSVTVHNGTADKNTYTENETVTITANEAEIGKRFKSWTINNGNISLADSTSSMTTFTMPARNVEVTANYENILYTVSFNLNGHGSAVADQTVTYGGLAVRPSNPQETGWSFTGWYTEADCKTLWSFNDAVTGNLTLYAGWSEVPKYILTVNNGEGDGSYMEGETVTVTADAPAPCTEFSVWRVDKGSLELGTASGSSSTINFVMPAEEIELTAVYTAPKHSFGGWEMNPTTHWHECVCGEKADEATHTYGSWKTTKYPTYNTEGERERSCTICGYTQTASIPKRDPEPTPTETPEPTATPVPTATPAPTATPVPTATPAPTATPVPTATPIPGVVEVDTMEETVVDQDGQTVTSLVQDPGTSNKIVITGLTDTTEPVTYESTNETAVEVDDEGNLTMKEPGMAEIVVTVGEGDNARKETIVIVVEEEPEIKNDPDEAWKYVLLGPSKDDVNPVRTLLPGEMEDINFYGVKNWKKENYEYTWESSDPSVLTTSKTGEIVALKPGIASVALKLRNKVTGELLCTKSIDIVVPASAENRIKLGTAKDCTFDALTLKRNERVDLNFYGVKNWKKENYEYVWTSSDKTIVWVDEIGKLTPVKPGKAVITLTLVDKTTGTPAYVVPVEVTVPEQ